MLGSAAAGCYDKLRVGADRGADRDPSLPGELGVFGENRGVAGVAFGQA